MAFDLVALAQAGANVIVSAMATDLWTRLRSEFGRLLGRGSRHDEDAVLAQLDDAEAVVRAATDDTATQDAQAELRALVKARLRAHPDLVEAFAALVEEAAARVAVESPAPSVQLQAHADHGSVVIMGGRDVDVRDTHLRAP